MSDEVIDLAKHLEYLNMDEDQVLRLAHSFKHLNIDQRRATPLQLRQIHALVVHISECRTPRCQYQYCRKVKAYLRHGALCKTRAAGGCYFCKNMCKILQHYSQACKESNCNKVFCSDFKECRRRAQKQSDSQRGGAEVAGSSNFKGTPEQLQLRQIHALVVHISECRTPRCQYQYCRKVKAYFRHSALCKTRAAGGCYFCKNMCKILQHYSQACKESNCNKVFCSDLKECRRRAQKQSDSQRGGAEVAGSSNFKGTPEQMRKRHDLVVHIPQCRTPRCQYPKCGKFKRLIRHGVLCKIRAAGGCHLCKELWHYIQHFSQACIESNCNEPLCRDLKECQRRAQYSEQLGAKLAEIVNFQGTPEQLREILDLVVHVSRCPLACCSYLNCSTAKGLFSHSSLCKTRFAGGCLVCKKLWRIIHLHAAACKKSNCNVPRCRDVKERLLHLVSLREAAVEVDCSS